MNAFNVCMGGDFTYQINIHNIFMTKASTEKYFNFLSNI